MAPAVQEILFRPMKASDIPELVAIESSWDGSRWTRAMFERELHLPMSVNVTAEGSNGEPVGFGVFWVVTDIAQLLEFAVHPDFQRQGIGGRLLRHLMEAARAKGCAKMELEFHEGNARALGLYIKEGFVITGRRRHFYDGAKGIMRDAILMERAL